MKIFRLGVAAALALLVVPVAANAAPEPPAPVFTEPRFTNACYNADDLDADAVDSLTDYDLTDINFAIAGTFDASVATTSIEVWKIPDAPAPPMFLGLATLGIGTWTYTPTLAQVPVLTADGYHLLHAFANNGLGVGRSLAGARAYCVDTLAPATAPTLLNPVDADPGVFPPLGTCVTNPFILSGGGAEPFANVIVEETPVIPGSSLWYTSADRTGAWSIDAAHYSLAGAPPGNHTVTVVTRQRDGGRNVGPDSVAVSFDVCDDRTPPGTPVITAPISGGEVPSGPVMTITGTVPFETGIRVFVREFSATPEVFADFEATVAASGDWTLTQTFPSSGIVTMQAYAQDLAGNKSALSNTVIKMVDANAPQVRINLPSGFLLADPWILSSPSFSGTAKDNYGLDHIEITYTPTLLGTSAATNPAACVDSNGACPTDTDDPADPFDTFEAPQATWSDAPPLALGLYTMRVVAVDRAMNRSAPDTMMVLIVDLP